MLLSISYKIITNFCPQYNNGEIRRERNSKKKFYATKRPITFCYVNVDNIVFSKLVKTKTNSIYLIGCVDKAIRQLVLIMPEMSRYVKTLKNKDRNNKLMSFRIDDEKQLEKYKTMWNKIEDLKNIKSNALPVYDYRYIKAKIRTYVDKIYTNFCGLNIPEADLECKFFRIMYIDSLLVCENKYYLEVYLDNCAYKIVNKQMTDYLDETFLEE